MGDLRDGRRFNLFFWVVLSWPRIQTGVRHGEISPHIRANPVRDVGLVHWININLVLARSWLVKVLGLRAVLHSEGKLRVLSGSVLGVRRVFEVEIACDLVVSGAWHPQVLDGLLSDLPVLPDVLIFDDGSLSVSPRVAERSLSVVRQLVTFVLAWERLTFENFARVLRRVLPRANGVFQLILSCPALQAGFNNYEAGN